MEVRQGMYVCTVCMYSMYVCMYSMYCMYVCTVLTIHAIPSEEPLVEGLFRIDVGTWHLLAYGDVHRHQRNRNIATITLEIVPQVVPTYTYIHTYIHTYTHTHIHTFIQK